KARDRTRQFLTRRIEERVVVEPRVRARRPRLRVLDQDQHGARAVAELGNAGTAGVGPQAEVGLVPVDRPVEVRDREMYGSEGKRCRERCRAWAAGNSECSHKLAS